MAKFQGYVKVTPKKVSFNKYLELVKQTNDPKLRKALLEQYNKAKDRTSTSEAKRRLRIIRTSPRASQPVSGSASQFQKFAKVSKVRRVYPRQSFNRINPNIPQRQLSIGEKMLIYKPTLVNQRLDPFVEPSGMDKELGSRFRGRSDTYRRTRSLDRLGARFDKPLSQD